MSLRRLLPRQLDDERGATAILVASSLLLLMGLVAIAVDTGIGWGDRRQQASAADVGALAALQFAKTTLPTSHPDCTGLTGKAKAACRGAEEAIAVIDGTLAGRYDDADWDACKDPDRPADYTILSAISECISFTANLQRSRVMLPGTDVDTAFARAIGFGSMFVTAFAEAGLEMDIVGGVFPFAVGPSGSGGSQACFAAGDTHTLDAAPCGSGNQGSYGKLNVKLYGNEDYPTPTICTGSNTQRLMTNVVAGSDHPMEPNPPKPGDPMKPAVNETANCANMANPVNQHELQTGMSPGWVDDGLFKGITTPPNLEGRLLCKGGLSSDQSREDYPLGSFTSTACEQILSSHPEMVDHTPLSKYIKSGAPGTAPGGACAPGQLKDRAGMASCLDWWKSTGPHGTNLFTSAIATSTRFGAVPILDQDPNTGTSVKYTIKEFRPVYLETVYLGCNAMGCSVVHSPGESSTGACPTPLTAADWSCGWPGTGNKTLEAVSAFVLTLDMLPGDLAEDFPFQPGTIVYNLHR